MTAKSRDAFALSEYFNATTTADSRRERARKEKDQRKKVKDDKIQNSNCKGKGENGKTKNFFVARNDTLQRGKSFRGNTVFFEERTLAPTLRSVQSEVRRPEIQQAASSQIRAVPRPSSLPLSSSSFVSFSLCSAAFSPFLFSAFMSCSISASQSLSPSCQAN